MNPFRVDWEPAAEDELARLWLQASDPQAITIAQAQADRLLALDPLKYGRHLAEGLYSIDVPPLVLTYTIDTVNHLVEVTWVRSTT